MIFPVILLTSVALATVGLIYLFGRKPGKFVDLGTVSASWLAEHRVSRDK